MDRPQNYTPSFRELAKTVFLGKSDTVRLAVRLLRHSADGELPRVLLGLFLLLLASGATLLQPWPLKIILDNVVGTYPPMSMLSRISESLAGSFGFNNNPKYSLLLVVCFAVLVIEALIGIFKVSSHYMLVSSGERMVFKFRCRLYNHFQRLSLAYHKSMPTGDSMYRVTSDTTSVAMILNNGLIPAATATESKLDIILTNALSGDRISQVDQDKFQAMFLYELGKIYHARGWVQQFHLGAARNNNRRLFEKLGPDTGFDSIGDYRQGPGLFNLFDRLDTSNQLAKSIIYNLNPVDNELFATLIGNYQDGSFPGKMQFGSGWWFLDQKDGMERQMNALSLLGLLSRFVGMLTDSRSFLSYPRHEYFRRILCNLIGNDVENGEVPADMELLGQLVENICYNNAVEYFGMSD